MRRRPRDARDAIGRDVSEMEAMVASLLAFLGGDDDPERRSRVDLAVLATTIVDDAADRARHPYAAPIIWRPGRAAWRSSARSATSSRMRSHYGSAVDVARSRARDRLHPDSRASRMTAPAFPRIAGGVLEALRRGSMPRAGATRKGSGLGLRSSSRIAGRRARSPLQSPAADFAHEIAAHVILHPELVSGSIARPLDGRTAASRLRFR
jgi:hypothetical protein